MRIIVSVPSDALEGKNLEELQAQMREYTGDAGLTLRVLPDGKVGVPANLLNCIAFAAWMEATDAVNGGRIKNSKKVQAPAGTVKYPVHSAKGTNWVWISLLSSSVGWYRFFMGYSHDENTLVLAEVE